MVRLLQVNVCCLYLLIVTNFILLGSPYFVLVLCKKGYQQTNQPSHTPTNQHTFRLPGTDRTTYGRFKKTTAEFREMLKAGLVTETKNEASDWCSQAFPVRKPNSWPIKCRWVTDFRNLNKALKRPVWGGESSGQLLRHVEPTARFFACFNAISGWS